MFRPSTISSAIRHQTSRAVPRVGKLLLQIPALGCLHTQTADTSPHLLKVKPKMARVVKCSRCLLPGSQSWTDHRGDAYAPCPRHHIGTMAVDSSDTSVRDALQQLEQQACRSLDFFSRKLTATEGCYSTFYSDYWLLTPWSDTSSYPWKEGGSVCSHALSHVLPHWPARQQHQLVFFSGFPSDIRPTHCQGHGC
jgi:hypothetical protein